MKKLVPESHPSARGRTVTRGSHSAPCSGPPTSVHMVECGDGACFRVPLPPNSFMFLHGLHSPQFGALHPAHLLHRRVLAAAAFAPWSEFALTGGAGGLAPPRGGEAANGETADGASMLALNC
jgi:hypothetical protein